MTTTRRLTISLATAFATALALGVALPGAAYAAYPSTNTTYSEVRDAYGVKYGSIKIKIGADKKKIAKVTVTAFCDDGSTDRVVWKNVKIGSSGSFAAEKYVKKKMVAAIQGQFESRLGAAGGVNIYETPCNVKGFAYYAEK